jgi:hypothetical protein
VTARPVVMAEFASGPALLDGVRAVAASGMSRLDAFTPYEVAGLRPLLGVRRSWLSWIVLAAGLAGGGGAYLLQWWINVVDYPINVGGRPYHSAPAFLPIAFEMAVLCAGAAALISAIVLGGLPRLWHPVFEIDGFDRATIDRFWLAVGAGDAALPAIDDPEGRTRVTTALGAAGAVRVLWLDGLDRPDRPGWRHDDLEGGR